MGARTDLPIEAGAELEARKAELRRRMRALRLALPEAVAAAAATAAARRLEASPLFRDARRIAVYVAVGGEMPTAPLISACRAAAKAVLLPRVPDGADALEFAPFPSGDALRPGRYAVPEPDGAAVELESSDLVVLPGLAFDAAGWRLGTGGGWYDRTFARWARGEGPRLVGLAFHAQIVEAVPHGPWDRRVDEVATERAWVRGKRAERSG